MSKKYDDIIAAGKRALARATTFDNPLRLFVEELEKGEEQAPPEVCPRGATCAGTPKPPSEPFTCMSNDCPLKAERIRRAQAAEATIIGEPLPKHMAHLTLLASQPPKMPERAKNLVTGDDWCKAVDCAEFWRDMAMKWKAAAESEGRQVAYSKLALEQLTAAERALRSELYNAKKRIEELELAAERAQGKGDAYWRGIVAQRDDAVRRAENAEKALDDARSMERVDCYANFLVVERYQKCVRKLLSMFPSDPIPASDGAHFWVERLEALIKYKLLVPNQEKTP